MKTHQHHATPVNTHHFLLQNDFVPPSHGCNMLQRGSESCHVAKVPFGCCWLCCRTRCSLHWPPLLGVPRWLWIKKAGTEKHKPRLGLCLVDPFLMPFEVFTRGTSSGCGAAKLWRSNPSTRHVQEVCGSPKLSAESLVSIVTSAKCAVKSRLMTTLMTHPGILSNSLAQSIPHPYR